jgi:hypothetical protein
LLPTILNGFLVWPERMVVPMFDEKVIGPIEDYMLRHQGVLKVCSFRSELLLLLFATSGHAR